VTAIVDTNGVIITGMPCEGYVYLFTECFNFTVAASSNSTRNIIVVDRNGILNQVAWVGSAKFGDVTSEYPLVFGKVPLSIETFGNTTLNSPIFHLTDELENEIGQFGGVYKSRAVVGELTFTITGADNDRIFINNFLLGPDSMTSANTAVAQTQSWPGFLSVEIPNIPSNQLIAYFMLVIPLIMLIVVVFTSYKRMKGCSEQDRALEIQT
jgi:hypothetical protein